MLERDLNQVHKRRLMTFPEDQSIGCAVGNGQGIATQICIPPTLIGPQTKTKLIAGSRAGRSGVWHASLWAPQPGVGRGLSIRCALRPLELRRAA